MRNTYMQGGLCTGAHQGHEAFPIIAPALASCLRIVRDRLHRTAANKPLREHVAPGHEWQMPQGGIDEDEDPLKAAIRELQEETNVTSASLIAEAPDWFAYDLPDDIAKEAWKGRYRGQRQKWFAFRFEGEESEIDIENPLAVTRRNSMPGAGRRWRVFPN